MEKKLKTFFDYQHFEKNERLEQLILETESRYGGELSDADLSLVNAAGELDENQVGGITGHNDNGTINNCYNTGRIRGNSIGIGSGGGGGEGAGGGGAAL